MSCFGVLPCARDGSHRAFLHLKSLLPRLGPKSRFNTAQIQTSGSRHSVNNAVLFPKGTSITSSSSHFQDSSRMLSHKKCFHHSSLFLEGKSNLPADSVRWGQSPKSGQEDEGGEESVSRIWSRGQEKARTGTLLWTRTKTWGWVLWTRPQTC